ncbi:MAG: energy transducer TonB [Acidobacteriota bacterium]|jgi:protein TonB|nr:energy transducer TonB [Acidobacteriota bacterium]
MLDYVNSFNEKRSVSRRKLACLAVSCLLHFSGIMTLYMFPWLLSGGYLHQFRGFRWGSVVTDEDMERWRMVAVLESPERMIMPSNEMLRKSLGLGDREEGAGSPPIAVSFNAPEAPETDKSPLPQILTKIEEPDVVIPENRRPGDGGEAKPDAGSPGETRGKEQVEPGTGKDVFAAKPESASKVEIAANAAPGKIPDGIQPPAPPPAAKPDVAKPAANESGGGSSVGFFENEGFPMGDYRDIINARVRSKWFIPSNMKGSLGRTVVVFYIDRDGGNVSGLQVETSSGNDSLDRAALSAVYGAAPFPPLPKGFPGRRVGVRLALIVDP